MPFIPKLRPVGEIAAVPNAPLDRLQRPTVNLSGVRQAVGQLGAASQMPLDNNDVTQGYRALGAVGEAVMRAGSVIGAVAMKRQEATDRRLVNQAQSAMDMAAMEFKAWQAENQNSPEAWTAEAQRRSADLLKPFMEMKELSKSAKDDLALMGQSWAGRFTKSVEIDATKAVFSLAAGSYQDRANRAYDQGDAAAGDAAIDEATTLGYFHPTVAESAKANGKLKTEAKAEAQRFDDLLGFADEKPLEAPGLIEQYHKEGKITSAQKLRLDNVRESAVNRERAKDNEVIKAAFMGGKLKEPADLEAFPYLTEGDKAEWTAQLKKPVMNDGEEYDSVLASIAKYDPSKDETGWEGAAISSRISQKFTLGYEKALSEKLDLKLNPDDSVSKDFAAATKSIFEAAEQASMAPLTETVDGVMRPVMREAKPVGDLPEVETRTKKTFMGIDWLNPDTVTKRNQARLYEGGEAVELDGDGKPKAKPMRPVMAPEANALKANNAKAKAVSEQFEREYANPATRKKWDADPVLMETRKLELMRAAKLPVVPSAIIGPSASLVDPTGAGYRAMTAEELAKGSK
jgi:hypothetical protein